MRELEGGLLRSPLADRRKSSRRAWETRLCKCRDVAHRAMNLDYLSAGEVVVGKVLVHYERPSMAENLDRCVPVRGDLRLNMADCC